MTSQSILDSSLRLFLRALASDSPTPGGGSVAALHGAMGAALVGMVCRLTIGKRKYADVEEEMQTILEQAEALRVRLTDLVDEDVAAFDQVMHAYRLPRETEQEESERVAAVQKALRHATHIPLATANACVQVIRLCEPLARLGNFNAISDAGTAAVTALAGVRGAALNVLINLSHLEDMAFVANSRQTIETLLADSMMIAEQVYHIVIERLEAAR